MKIGEYSNKLDILLKEKDLEDWAFITSENPNGEAYSVEANQVLYNELIDAIQGFSYYLGEGQGIDTSWPAEKSVLILGINKDEAKKLGKRFNQNAIIVGKLGRLAELLIIK